MVNVGFLGRQPGGINKFTILLRPPPVPSPRFLASVPAPLEPGGCFHRLQSGLAQKPDPSRAEVHHEKHCLIGCLYESHIMGARVATNGQSAKGLAILCS